MIGRRVRVIYPASDGHGTVTQWAPLGAAMCDALVALDSGGLCWYASSALRPIDDRGPLPSRADAQEAARLETLASLRKIRKDLIAEWSRPWPGCEHGKALLGKAIDGAIDSVVDAETIVGAEGDDS